MSGKGDIHNDPKANTAGFRQHPENIGGGRKKKIYTILKEMGYSKDDITTAFKELGFNTLPELEELSKDETKPAIVRIIANQFLLAYKDGDWTKIREIMQHVIGMPKQSVSQKSVVSYQNVSEQFPD